MIRLKRIQLKNYKIHRHFEAIFESDIYELNKPNEFGKSTLFEAICDAFTFSVDKIKDKSTKGSVNLPVIILDFELDNERYTLTLNAQSDYILLEGSNNGVYLQSKRSITDFFDQKGYSMFPFVVSQLLLIREKDITIKTDNPDLKKFTGDIFNVENINTLIKILTEKFLTERNRGLKKGGFGDVLAKTTEEINILRGEISDFEEKVKEYNRATREYKSVAKEKENLEKDIHAKEKQLEFIRILKDMKKKEELSRKKINLENQLKQVYKEQDSLIDTREQLSRRLIELKDSRKKLKDEIDKALELSSRIKELKYEDEKIKTELKRIDSLKEEIERLQNEKELIEKELKTLEKTIDDLKRKNEIISQIIETEEEVEKIRSSLGDIKEKKNKIREVNNTLNTLLEKEEVISKLITETEDKKVKLQRDIDGLKGVENIEVLRERLSNVEEELTVIYNSLKEIEKLQKEMGTIKKETQISEGLSEEELTNILMKWQMLSEQRNSTEGEIVIINGSASINGNKKSKGESYLFKGKAVIEKDDLKLEVYTLPSLKQTEEELSKYILQFGSMDKLKNIIGALKTIREKEIKIASLGPENLKKRHEELGKERMELKKSIEELEKQHKKLEKLQNDMEELIKEYREYEIELNKIQGAIAAIKKQKEEIEREVNIQNENELNKSLKDKEALLKDKFRQLGYNTFPSLERMRKIQKDYTEEFNRKREEIAGITARLDSIKKRITTINSEIKALSPDTKRMRQKTLNEEISAIEKELKDQNELNKSLKSIETQIGEIQKELEKLSRKQGAIESTIKNLREKIEEVEDVLSTINVSEESLDNIPFGVIKKYMALDSESLEKEVKTMSEDIKSLRSKLTEVSERAGILKTRLEYVPDIKSLEEKRKKLLESERKLERIERMRTVLGFTKDLLIFLRENIEKEYLLRLEKETGRIFSQITGGRYHIASFQSDTLFVNTKKTDSFEKRWEVQDKTGNVYSFEELSDGTKTQLLLSIRLALISLFFGKNTAFLMLDEPFAYFDRQREENTRKILKQLTGMNWQILISSAKT